MLCNPENHTHTHKKKVDVIAAHICNLGTTGGWKAEIGESPRSQPASKPGVHSTAEAIKTASIRWNGGPARRPSEQKYLPPEDTSQENNSKSCPLNSYACCGTRTHTHTHTQQ